MGLDEAFGYNLTPMSDIHHLHLQYRLSEIRHRYGPRVHILSHPTLMTVLARLCSPETRQPAVSRLTTQLYRAMALTIADHAFPRVQARVPTRMRRYHREGVYVGEVIDPKTRVVLVDVVRAGMLPSQVCFETFCELVEPDNVRQDHFFSQRVTVNGRVTGADLRGSKVGGRYDGRIVVVPDPMAATGSSLATVLDYIYGLGRGKPARVIAAHLIVTPEYIRRVRAAHPGLEVYAIRLDRGLSAKNVLRTTAGARWAEERGLNARQYIVPGAGGMGELLSGAQE